MKRIIPHSSLPLSNDAAAHGEMRQKAAPERSVHSEWRGCYDDGWQGEIVPEAFAHPAKVSRALIRRIYQHAFVEGWLLPGDTVVDPFGGIAGTALDAMWNGLTWLGCELEPKFVALGQQNIDLWDRKYGGKLNFGLAEMLQGDSRRLSSVITEAHCLIGSPPFLDILDIADTKRRGGDLIQKIAIKHGNNKARQVDGENKVYGNSPGQLSAMREGTAPALICSSPPYAAISTGAGGLNTKPGADGQQSGRSASAPSQDTDQRYGETAGQLATMREGEAPACIVSSPPFENQEPSHAQGSKFVPTKQRADRPFTEASYGSADGNIGNQAGDTFWQAAREIVAQCHQVLRPGGHAIWITKRFVRKGKIVEFSDQWAALCEQDGFDLVCRHRAMLVANHGTQGGMFGEDTVVSTARKSFFRRLAEAKGSPAIDWEDVLCMVKR